MVTAICFRCGAPKNNPLITCVECENYPQTSIDYLVSIVFSEYISSRKELQRFAEKLLKGDNQEISSEVYEKASSALRCQEFMENLSQSTLDSLDKNEAGDSNQQSILLGVMRALGALEDRSNDQKKAAFALKLFTAERPLDALDMTSFVSANDNVRTELGTWLPELQENLKSLRTQILSKSVSYLPMDMWYKNYINPFSLLNKNPHAFLTIHRSASKSMHFIFNEKAFEESKQQLFHEIDKKNNKIEWLPGLLIDRSKAIFLLSGLEVPSTSENWNHHESKFWREQQDIYEDPALNAFLMRGDLSYFLINEKGTGLSKTHKLEGALGSKFAAQFDAVLSHALRKNDVSVVKCIMGGRWCMEVDILTSHLKQTIDFITGLFQPLMKLVEESANRSVSINEIKKVVDNFYILTIFPFEINEIHEKIVFAICRLAIANHETKRDLNTANEILSLGDLYARWSDALREKIKATGITIMTDGDKRAKSLAGGEQHRRPAIDPVPTPSNMAQIGAKSTALRRFVWNLTSQNR